MAADGGTCWQRGWANLASARDAMDTARRSTALTGSAVVTGMSRRSIVPTESAGVTDMARRSIAPHGERGCHGHGPEEHRPHEKCRRPEKPEGCPGPEACECHTHKEMEE